MLTKIKSIDMREYTLDQVIIPSMYFQEQAVDFANKRNYLSTEFKKVSTTSTADDNAGPSAPKAIKRPSEIAPAAAKRLRNA